jgi:ankyrin repeat protein
MLLLDLPPELFERVVVHLVTDLGIAEAWEYRRACRKFTRRKELRINRTDSFAGTFRRAIEFESLANQPTIAFLGQDRLCARRILGNYNGLYLSYRVRAENGAYSFLPRLIKGACDNACSDLDCDEQVLLESTRALCDAVVEKFPDRINDLLECELPNQSWIKFLSRRFEKDESKTKVAAAAAFGNLEVLRTTLRHRDHVWNRSYIFGYPIVLAAAGGHLEVVRAIVKQFEKTHHRMTADKWTDQFSAAIDNAFKYNHQDIVLLLLRILDEYGPSIKKPNVGSWSERARQTGNVEVIDQVRRLRRNYHLGSPHREDVVFTDACVANDLATVRMFIDEGRLSLNCIFSTEKPFTPIQLAARSRSANAVRLLLEMGSDPDAGYQMWPLVPSALKLAVDNTDHNMVRILLQHGARPKYVLREWPLIAGIWDESPIMGTLFMEARKRRPYYKRSKGPRTNLTLDAEGLVQEAEKVS